MPRANVRAGDLDTLITFTTPVVTQDSVGGKIETYSTFSTVWAKVQFNPGGRRDTTISGGSKVETQATFTIRHLSGLTNNHRILLNGKTYEITRIDDLYNQHQYMIIDTRSIN